MTPGPTSERWRQAQRYEADWWLSHRDGFDADYLERYAADVEREVFPHLGDLAGSAVLETGGGPVGIAPFLHAAQRVVTDPLHEVFEREPAFREFRARYRAGGAEYLPAKGEALPFEGASFDLYVSDNALDHAESPARFLAEAYRVLRPGGVAFVRVHVYHTWGRFVRGALERFTIDKGHPHTFSSVSFEGLARAQGFQVVVSQRTPFLEGWRHDWRRALAGQRKALAQALLLVTRAEHTLLLRKPHPAA